MSIGFSRNSNTSPSAPTDRRAPRGIHLRRHAGEHDGHEDAPADQTGDGDEDPPEHGQPETLGEGFRLIVDTAIQRVVIVVVNFLGWAGTVRQSFFRSLVGLDRPFAIRVEGGDGEFLDPFEFVLAQMVGPGDAERCQTGRQAAVEAAAVFLPYEIEHACDRIRARLQELEVFDQPLEDLQDEVIALVDDVPDEVVVEQPVRVQDLLPTAPVAAASIVPRGWTLSPNGLARGLRLVLYTALVIVRRLIADDDAEMLELAFFRNNEWQHCEVACEQVTTNQRIIRLARTGLPVNADNARDVVAYLAAYAQDNLGSIPTVNITRRTGWHTIDGREVFVLPDRVIVARDTSTSQENPHDQPAGIIFRASADGPAQVTSGLCTAGTLAGWRETMTLIGPYPRARFAFYVALVPALLQVLGTPKFVVDFCGPTSQGKTTVLRIAAATWGDPDETTDHSLMINWDSTPAYRLGVAAALADNGGQRGCQQKL
jgi:hypothetical protein